MNQQSVLIVINGVGLGNVIRCGCLISELKTTGIEIHVAASGKAYEWLKKSGIETRILELTQPQYPKNIFGTFQCIFNFLKISLSNRNRLLAYCQSVKPSLLIVDSFYGITKYDMPCPVIGINNSGDVVATYVARFFKPICCFPQFLFVELLDYLFHKLFITHVISPSLSCQLAKTSRSISVIPPIVRKLNSAPSKDVMEGPKNRKRIAVLMPGSGTLPINLDSNLTSLYSFDFIGAEGISSDHIRYWGYQEDPSSILNNADILVIGGGFSSCSEAYLLQKPVVVVPIPWHCEQRMNAYHLMKIMPAIEQTTLSLNVYIQKLELITKNRSSFSHTSVNGAFSACTVIKQFLTKVKHGNIDVNLLDL